MTCKISCLVPRTDQLEPLIRRIREAGIEPRDIVVIPHEQWRLASAEEARRPAGTASSTPWLEWWQVPFAQGALCSLWWQWATGASCGAWPDMPAGGERPAPAVISLAQYEAGRRKPHRRTPA